MLQALRIANEETIVSTVRELCDAAEGVIILSREDVSHATDLVKVIKARHKEIEDERVALVKPLNDTVGRINDRFKAILAPLGTAEDDVKGKMLAFDREERRKVEAASKEAERLAAEAAAKAAAEATEKQESISAASPAPAVSAPPVSTYGQYGGVSTIRKTWAYELVDIVALANARPDLVTVDAAKINAAIRGKGGEIPGLRIFEKETIAVR